jgi:rare lipoprotein A
MAAPARFAQEQGAGVRGAPWLALALLTALAASGCAIVTRESEPKPEAGARGTEPYRVRGRTYTPLRDWRGYSEVGLASWYGARHHGRLTASGERFDSHRGYTAAHKALPFGVCARVENVATGASVVVRINDRGPFVKGRVIDLSRAAAARIGLLRAGIARVRVEAVAQADAGGRCDPAAGSRSARR